jgi:nucleoside-diphosphate-sugar epimerase
VYVSDIRRAREDFGWSPRVTPEHGVARMVGWLQENRAQLGAFAGAL